MNPRTQQRMTDVGLLLIRAILAVVFIYHGGQKLFGLFGGKGGNFDLQDSPDFI